MAFEYRDTAVAVREDVAVAHRYAWQQLARPGNWWHAAERIAIAAETRQARQCGLCARRRSALSPHTVEGEHEAVTALPAAAIEAIHQVTSDPARLHRPWFEGLLSAEFTDGHYVELLGVLVTVVCIDAVHQVLGLPPEPLPAPAAGAPDHYRPAVAKRTDQAWVPMIFPADARGTAEADLYPGSRTGNVIMAMSLVPDAVRLLNVTQKAHYLDLGRVGFGGGSGRALSRPQIELLAARVSAINDCFY